MAKPQGKSVPPKRMPGLVTEKTGETIVINGVLYHIKKIVREKYYK